MIKDSSEVGRELLNGIFSINRSRKIGTGATTRRIKQLFYYFAEEDEEGNIYIQPLDGDYSPVGNKETIDRDDLLRDYLPEPAIYQEKFLPKMREIQKAVARGDKYRRRGESFTAEFEYSKALKLDVRNVRANFGIGLCYIQRGEKEKAHEVFERVISIDASFDDDHKHLFNEFGISLRKQGMYDEAVEYYGRAMELTQGDENLYYNLGRAYFEKGENGLAAEHLSRCLEMNPDHEEASSFIAHMKKKDLI